MVMMIGHGAARSLIYGSKWLSFLKIGFVHGIVILAFSVILFMATYKCSVKMYLITVKEILSPPINSY